MCLLLGTGTGGTLSYRSQSENDWRRSCAGVCNNNYLKLRQFVAHLENVSRLGFKYKLNVGIEVQIQTNRLHNQSLYLATLATPTQDNYGIIMHMKQLTSAIQFLRTSVRS